MSLTSCQNQTKTRRIDALGLPQSFCFSSLSPLRRPASSEDFPLLLFFHFHPNSLKRFRVGFLLIDGKDAFIHVFRSIRAFSRNRRGVPAPFKLPSASVRLSEEVYILENFWRARRLKRKIIPWSDATFLCSRGVLSGRQPCALLQPSRASRPLLAAAFGVACMGPMPSSEGGLKPPLQAPLKTPLRESRLEGGLKGGLRGA